MRKITLFLMSLFLTVGAMAQIDYWPTNAPTTNTKKSTDRNMTSVKVGTVSYSLTNAEQAKGYVDNFDNVTFQVKQGETYALEINTNGSWIHGSVFVDFEKDGFTASVTESWKPAEDLVAYSFYNNGTSSDASGWNSVGTVISGDNRNRPAIPSWTVPADLALGEYRIRFKLDWCSIDPQGDADSKFGDFYDNRGSILDAKLVVEPAPVVYETEEVGNPTVDGVYRVYWKGQERGYLAYHNDYPTKPVLADVNLSGHNGIDKHYKSTEDGVQREWYLITSNSGRKYLFSPYTGKFLTYSKDAADSGKGALYDTNRPLEIAVESNTHTDWNSYYILTATIDDVKYLLSSGCGTPSRGANAGYPVRWAKAEGDGGQMHDGGSPLTFVKVIDFPVDEAILAQAEAAINDYENPVEANVNFEWTTSTPWTAVENDAYYTSTVFNDNELDGVKYIEGEVTVGGARTATVTFTYIDGGHKLNIRGVEVIDAKGNIVAGDYHVGIAGGTTNTTDNVYTVNVAEAGTYKVRCYAAEGNGDQFNSSNGSIVVSFAKLNVMDLTKSVTFAAEYATLYLGYNVTIPAGVEAYVLTGVNPTWVELTQLHNIIPANTAVILKGTANSSYNFNYTSDEAEDVEINYLEGSIADRYVQGDAYVLGIPEGETEPALCKAVLNKVGNTSFKNNANKAYLKVAPGMSPVSFYGFRFDNEETTAIENVEVVTEDVIFDLSGRRVSEITEKGIYIVNGKKVIK